MGCISLLIITVTGFLLFGPWGAVVALLFCIALAVRAPGK